MATPDTRHKLIDAISRAAELEHMLCCSYLFAAFSLKRTPDATLTAAEAEITRRWTTTIMLVARQEMEHLGMACNLLSAIGAGANFSRPNFPQPADYLPIPLPFELRAFGEQALGNFMKFEQPHWPEQGGGDDVSPGGWSLPYTSLQGLYDYIRNGFVALDKTLGAEALFVGPPRAQISNENLFDQSDAAYGVNLQGVSAPDPKDRLAQAVAIVDQIIAEGEGAVNDIGTSHYARFKAIHAELTQLKEQKGDAFQPAYPVVLNPKTFRHSGALTGTEITDPLALEVARLFNLVYEAVMLLLIRFYGYTDETDTEITALQEIAFFPLMTMGIRPIAEVLVQLPASPVSNERAGPTFELTRSLKFLPHKQAAWQVLQEFLDETGAEATRISQLAEQLQSPTADRLQFIAKSLVRNAKNFRAYIKGQENI